MAKRGRKSAASRAVVSAETDVVPRPPAPPELTGEQALEWARLVNSMPADYFARPSHGALVQLCRHLVVAQRLARLIEACAADETLDAEAYRVLLKEQRAELMMIERLLRGLRLVHVATKRVDRTPLPDPSPRPWE